MRCNLHVNKILCKASENDTAIQCTTFREPLISIGIYFVYKVTN